MSGKDATICAHAGSLAPSTRNRTGGYSAKKAIWQASVYDFESLDDLHNASFLYRRLGCPNMDELGSTVAALEGAEAVFILLLLWGARVHFYLLSVSVWRGLAVGLATSTGMGAIVAAVMSICKSGDLVIVNSDVYGVTYEFFNVDMRRFGIEVVLEDVFELHVLDNILEGFSRDSSNGSMQRNVVVFLESITNPLVKVANISAMASVCKKYGATLIVDNTMATPLRVKPLLEGANLVIHSATKYLGGHSDLMAGVVVGSSSSVEQAAVLGKRWGLTTAPFDAWLAIRGIQTLQVRMQRAWHSATILSDHCVASGLALRVHSAPMCAIVCIEVCGGLEGAEKAIKAFKLIKLSPSFGGISTTVSHSATSSHKCLGAELREKLGITDGILRLSVGLEDVEEIWADLQAGLLAASN